MTRLRRHSYSLLLLGTLACAPHSLLAQDTAKTAEIIPDPYPKNYTLLQVNLNQPAARSQNFFIRGKEGFGVSYSYYLARRLIVGVNFKNRMFLKKNGQNLSLMTFGNHTQGVFRLYHPLYLLLGTEWNYMIPMADFKLPMIKDPAFTTEIGVAATASLWYFLTPSWLSEWKIQRWKGTKTSRLDGWEFSIGMGYGF